MYHEQEGGIENLSPVQSELVEMFAPNGMGLLASQLVLLTPQNTALSTDWLDLASYEHLVGVQNVVMDNTPESLVIGQQILLENLGLTDIWPDRKTLMERLDKNAHYYFDIPKLYKKSRELVSLIISISNITFDRMDKDKDFHPFEEQILENLAKVLEVQLVREGNICPLALTLASELEYRRPDYFGDNSREIINSLRAAPESKLKLDLLEKLTRIGESAYIVGKADTTYLSLDEEGKFESGISTIGNINGDLDDSRIEPVTYEWPMVNTRFTSHELEWYTGKGSLPDQIKNSKRVAFITFLGVTIASMIVGRNGLHLNESFDLIGIIGSSSFAAICMAELTKIYQIKKDIGNDNF